MRCFWSAKTCSTPARSRERRHWRGRAVRAWACRGVCGSGPWRPARRRRSAARSWPSGRRCPPRPRRRAGPEVAVDGAARREIPRQHPPLATGLQQVEHRVDHLGEATSTAAPPVRAAGRCGAISAHSRSVITFGAFQASLDLAYGYRTSLSIGQGSTRWTRSGSGRPNSSKTAPRRSNSIAITATTARPSGRGRADGAWRRDRVLEARPLLCQPLPCMGLRRRNVDRVETRPAEERHGGEHMGVGEIGLTCSER